MAGTESLPTPQDTNQNFALIGVQGTAGTADTRGTSVTMPISVDPLTGAMNVKDLSGAAGTTNVQVLGGSVVVTAGTTKITDGTQVANTLAGDTGQNPLLQAGVRKELSFTTTTVQAVGTADVSNYRSVSVHIVTQGASSTITFQGSNDNTNWVSLALVQPSNTLSSPSTSTSSAGVMFVGNLSFRYFRLNVTGIASGTTAGVIEFFSEPMSNLTSIAGQIAINGTQAVAMSSGTLNAGTINMINAGTITSSGTTTGVGVVTTVTNLSNGSIKVTAGTEIITSGSISVIAGTGIVTSGSVAVTAGTMIMTAGTVTAGTINAGTVRVNYQPIVVSNTYGTTTAGTIGTLVAAPSAGSAIVVTGLDVQQVSGTAETVVSWGLAANGAQVLSRGNYVAGGGISKNMVSPVSGSATGTALTFNMLSGSGTVTYVVSYFVAVP